MAYSAGDYMLIIRGSVSASEEWSNTWCVDSAAAATPQQIVDVFHDFYDELFTAAANRYTFTTSADSCRMVNLSTSVDESVTWASITGSGSDDQLPPEVALRVSLASGNNRHGGPFLPAPNLSVLTQTGALSTTAQTAIVALLQTLVDDLDALDVAIELNSPADEVLNPLSGIKLGTTFDVQRSRRRSLPEAYANVTLP